MMKKLLTVILVIGSLIIAEESFAQAGIRLGVKGGLNFADYKTEFNSDGSTGYHFGAFATIKATKIAVQPEVLFSTQSAEIDFATARQEFKSSYVNVPVLVKFYLVQGLNIYAGPQLGFATLQEATDLTNNNKEDLKSELRDTDMSAVFGLGVDLPFGLGIEARYNLGLSDISDEYDWDINTTGNEELKNQVFQVSLSYALIKTD